MSNAGIEKKLWGHRWTAAVFAALLLAILALGLSLSAGPAAALCGNPDGCAPDPTGPPTVTSVSPPEDATGASPSTDVTATFSETMDSSTINTSTFTLVTQGPTTPVPATVTYNATTDVATLNPNNVLAQGATYIAPVTTGAKGVAGNALMIKTWRFTVKP